MIFKLRVQQIDPLMFKQDDKPSGQRIARAHIVIDDSFLLENDNGTIVLSAECRTAREVEEYVDQMIRELEQLKRKAKSAFITEAERAS
jgi:hypothetical protein